MPISSAQRVAILGGGWKRRPSFDTFTRANGAIGTAESGEPWAQVAAASQVTLATISSNALVLALSAVSATACYNGLDVGAGRLPTRMAATIRFAAGTQGFSAAALVSNPNGLTAVSDITAGTGSLHITFGDRWCSIGVWDSNVITYVVSNYTYASACARDGATTYNVGWSIEGTILRVEMPDGTVQTYNDPRFATHNGRYCTFEHYLSDNAECQPIFDSIVIESAASRFASALT